MSASEKLKKKKEAIILPKKKKKLDILDKATGIIMIAMACLVLWGVSSILLLLVSKTTFLKGLFNVLAFIGKWGFIVLLIAWVAAEAVGFYRRIKVYYRFKKLH